MKPCGHIVFLQGIDSWKMGPCFVLAPKLSWGHTCSVQSGFGDNTDSFMWFGSYSREPFDSGPLTLSGPRSGGSE